MAALHISISAETVAHIGPLPISNSMLTSIVVSVFIVGFALLIKNSLATKGKISRLQALGELIVEIFYNLCMDITSSVKRTRLFAPLILSFFLFILLNNWAGLIPGVGTIGFNEHETVKAEEVKTSESTTVEPEAKTEEKKSELVFVPYFRAATADLNTTLALAAVSVFLTQYYGFSALGLSYLKKYFNFESPIMVFVGLLELILEFAKIVSFAFRLFGNIFAGEVLLSVMMFLVPVIVPMPFYGLELFVGAIQALVFSMLTLVFFNLASLGHEEEHAEEKAE